MAPPGEHPLLSVLIATLDKREPVFLELLGGLLKQALAADAPIEVGACQNRGEHPLAVYRQRLLDDARGQFTCFIDDDDAIPDYYVAEIVAALRSVPDADVVTWLQDGTGTAANLTLFGLAFRHAPWQPVMVDGIEIEGRPLGPQPCYLRAYSHMQPLRAEVAKAGSFIGPDGPGWTQEDQHYAHMIVPLLIERGSREVYIPKVMYTYRWMHTGESTQEGPQKRPQRDADHDRPVIGSPCFRWCGT